MSINPLAQNRQWRGIRKTGFSLVEVVMALGIATFGFLVLFALLPTSLNVMRESTDEAIAVNIVTGMVSDLKNCDSSNQTAIYKIPVSNAGSGTLYFDETGRLLGDMPSNSAIYKASWSIRLGDTAQALAPNAHLFVSRTSSTDQLVEALVILKDGPGS